MRVLDCSIPDVKRIDMISFEDRRGQFLRLHDEAVYNGLGIVGPFAQLNASTSGPDVLRGLHFQRRLPQGKLLSVLSGAVVDVAVDVRADSPTLGRWVSTELDANRPTQIWVPPGFAHGFCVVRAPAVVVYQTTEPHDPDDQWGIRWNDPTLGIPWPTSAPVLSDRDRALPTWDEAMKRGLFEAV